MEGPVGCLSVCLGVFFLQNPSLPPYPLAAALSGFKADGSGRLF